MNDKYQWLVWAAILAVQSGLFSWLYLRLRAYLLARYPHNAALSDLVTVADQAVQAVEQLSRSAHGQQKYDAAVEYFWQLLSARPELKEYVASPEHLKILIEAAVKRLPQTPPPAATTAENAPKQLPLFHVSGPPPAK